MNEVEFSRSKAYFHRVLGELLQDLATWEQTHWLEEKEVDKQHTLRGEGEANSYGRALYLLTSLEPYQNKLDELQGIQDAALRNYNLKRIPHALLLPLIHQDIHHVRIQKSTYHSSRAYARSVILERIDSAVETVSANYNRHAQHSLDDKTRSIGDEIAYHKNVREWIRNSSEDKYRLRIREQRYRLYLYRLGGSTCQSETRQHGVIVVGPNISVERVDSKETIRRERSDKISMKPLWHYGVSSVYPESQWQAAKTDRAKL